MRARGVIPPQVLLLVGCRKLFLMVAMAFATCVSHFEAYVRLGFVV